MSPNVINQLDNKPLSEISDLQKLTEGCNNAIVTYSLSEDLFRGYNTNKIVIFFPDNFCHETLNKEINNIMMEHSQSLAKSHLYKLNNNCWIKQKFKFLTCLFRSILGVNVNNDIADYRKIMKGGYNGTF